MKLEILLTNGLLELENKADELKQLSEQDTPHVDYNQIYNELYKKADEFNNFTKNLYEVVRRQLDNDTKKSDIEILSQLKFEIYNAKDFMKSLKTDHILNSGRRDKHLNQIKKIKDTIESFKNKFKYW